MPRRSVSSPPKTFQELIFALQRYWSGQGCVILQPYDMEMGAGTFHTGTFLRVTGPGAVECRVRSTEPSSDRWALW